MKKTQWTGHEDHKWRPTSTTTSTITPGMYSIGIDREAQTWTLEPETPIHDKTIRVGLTDYLCETMTEFTKAKDKYKEFNLLHKRGFLLSGEAGTGKTQAAVAAIEEMISKEKAIGIIVDNCTFITGVLRGIREIEPTPLLICLWEDFDKIAKVNGHPSWRSVLTSLLDGETQVDNVVHIATTNNFDIIDPCFSNRPSRFDDVLWIGPPNEATRRAYLTQMAPKASPDLIEEVTQKSEGFMFAHLKEFLTSTFVLGYSVDDTVSRLKAMTAEKVKADTARKQGLTFAALAQALASATQEAAEEEE